MNRNRYARNDRNSRAHPVPSRNAKDKPLRVHVNARARMRAAGESEKP